MEKVYVELFLTDATELAEVIAALCTVFAFARGEAVWVIGFKSSVKEAPANNPVFNTVDRESVVDSW